MKPQLFDSIASLLLTLDLPKPLHPLITIVDKVDLENARDKLPENFLFNFYIISYKSDPPGKLKYGQHYYEFDESTMIFLAPGQMSAVADDLRHAGYSLLVHPDFFRNYPLAQNIKKYSFFSYSVNEALHLSEKERSIIINVFQNLHDELRTNIENFSQDLIITQIELLLNYSNRFYKRQFTTFNSVSNDLLVKLEGLLAEYFIADTGLYKGLYYKRPGN